MGVGCFDDRFRCGRAGRKVVSESSPTGVLCEEGPEEMDESLVQLEIPHRVCGLWITALKSLTGAWTQFRGSGVRVNLPNTSFR